MEPSSQYGHEACRDEDIFERAEQLARIFGNSFIHTTWEGGAVKRRLLAPDQVLLIGENKEITVKRRELFGMGVMEFWGGLYQQPEILRAIADFVDSDEEAHVDSVTFATDMGAEEISATVVYTDSETAATGALRTRDRRNHHGQG